MNTRVRDNHGVAKLRQQDALDIPDKTTRLSAVAFAIRCEGRTAIESVLSLVRHFAPMRDDREWDPDPWLLGCPNGTLDLRTGELRAADSNDRITLNTTVQADAGSGQASETKDSLGIWCRRSESNRHGE